MTTRPLMKADPKGWGPPAGAYRITLVGTGGASTPTQSVALTVRVTDCPPVPPMLAGVVQVVDLLLGVRRRLTRAAATRAQADPPPRRSLTT
ncbi:hypothetical protein [Streptomyces sp. NPDC007369]|uniref:hypothetical protein n=1 Tax=Streptomyces sp. NPDC007369 TaxID=3154589 RepID=UPI0034039D90